MFGYPKLLYSLPSVSILTGDDLMQKIDVGRIGSASTPNGSLTARIQVPAIFRIPMLVVDDDISPYIKSTSNCGGLDSNAG